MKYVDLKELKDILDRSEIVIGSVFDTTTVVSVKLPNGFVITKTSSCVDKEIFDLELGAEICLAKIEEELISYLGFTILDNINKGEN